MKKTKRSKTLQQALSKVYLVKAYVINTPRVLAGKRVMLVVVDDKGEFF